MRELSERRYGQGLAALIAIRALAVVALWLCLPEHLQFWKVYYETNDVEYFRIAQALAHGHAVTSFRTIGYPLTLVPWIWLIGAHSPDQLVGPVVLFQGTVLGSAIMWLIADIARLCARHRSVGLLTAGLWMALPAAVYVGVRLIPGLEYPLLRISRLEYLLGMKLSSDAWTLWWVLLVVWSAAQGLREPDRRRWPVICGLAAGGAGLTVCSSAVIGLVGLVWAIQHRWRALLLICVTALAIMSAQALYDRGAGDLSFAAAWVKEVELTVYAEPPLPETAVWSVAHWPGAVRRLTEKLSPAVWLVLACVTALAVRGWRRLVRSSPRVGALIVLWLVPWLLAYGGYWDFGGNALRLSLPVMPALLLLAAVSLTS